MKSISVNNALNQLPVYFQQFFEINEFWDLALIQESDHRILAIDNAGGFELTSPSINQLEFDTLCEQEDIDPATLLENLADEANAEVTQIINDTYNISFFIAGSNPCAYAIGKAVTKQSVQYL